MAVEQEHVQSRQQARTQTQSGVVPVQRPKPGRGFAVSFRQWISWLTGSQSGNSKRGLLQDSNDDDEDTSLMLPQPKIFMKWFVDGARNRLRAGGDKALRSSLTAKLDQVQAEAMVEEPDWVTINMLIDEISEGLKDVPVRITRTASGTCNRVITLPQFTGTCWFNAILMAVFFSQGMREYILAHCAPKWPSMIAQRWGGNTKMLQTAEALFTTFEQLLGMYKYETEQQRIETYDTLDALRPEQILQQMHILDPQLFTFNPRWQEGYRSELYVTQFLKLLGADFVHVMLLTLHQRPDGYCPVLAFNGGWQRRVVGMFKPTDFSEVAELTFSDVKVLAVTTSPAVVSDFWAVPHKVMKQASSVTYARPRPDGRLEFMQEFRHDVPANFRQSPRFPDYSLDSMTLGDFNTSKTGMGHEIAGVTCDGKRFLYNGWASNTADPAKRTAAQQREIPCPLMAFDWIQSTKRFCFTDDLCSMRTVQQQNVSKAICFAPSGMRTFLAIRSASSSNSGNSSHRVVRQSGGRRLKQMEPVLPKTIQQGTNVFCSQLAALLAMDGPVTVSKVGKTYVLKTRTNKATVPQELAPALHAAYTIAKAPKNQRSAQSMPHRKMTKDKQQ